MIICYSQLNTTDFFIQQPNISVYHIVSFKMRSNFIILKCKAVDLTVFQTEVYFNFIILDSLLYYKHDSNKYLS